MAKLNVDGLASSLPLVGSLFDSSDQDAIENVKRLYDMYMGVNLPDMSWEEFNPMLANYSLVQEDPMKLMAQDRAISLTKDLADRGLTSQDELNQMRAIDDAEGFARRSREAALNKMMAQGGTNSGMARVMGEMGSQEAAERARRQMMEDAAMTAKGRALNQANYTNQLGDQRDQNYRTNALNTGIINQFNRMNTDTRNDAQWRNNMGRRDANQQHFNNQMTRLDGVSGASRDLTNAYAARNAARTSDRNANTEFLGSLVSMGMGKPKG